MRARNRVSRVDVIWRCCFIVLKEKKKKQDIAYCVIVIARQLLLSTLILASQWVMTNLKLKLR